MRVARSVLVVGKNAEIHTQVRWLAQRVTHTCDISHTHTHTHTGRQREEHKCLLQRGVRPCPILVEHLWAHWFFSASVIVLRYDWRTIELTIIYNCPQANPTRMCRFWVHPCNAIQSNPVIWSTHSDFTTLFLLYVLRPRWLGVAWWYFCWFEVYPSTCWVFSQKYECWVTDLILPLYHFNFFGLSLAFLYEM
jgi:hypothetical protein